MDEKQLEKKDDDGFLGDGRSNKQLSRPPHALTTETFVAEIGANIEDGLTEEEVKERRLLYGENIWQDNKVTPWWKIIIRQIANPMGMVLILCMGICFGIESYMEGCVVAIVSLLNVVIGSVMDIQAAKKMDALKKMTTPTGNAVRAGHSQVIPSKDLVVGDLVNLRAGDKVPADVRLVETMNFEVDESSLTGESIAVSKYGDRVYDTDAANRNAGDRLNIAFSTCQITKGRAKGVVFATGMTTALGQIAQMSKKPSKIRQAQPKKDGRDPGAKEKLVAILGTLKDLTKEFFGFGNDVTRLQEKLAALAVILFVLAVAFFFVVMGANKWQFSEKEVVIYGVGTGLSMIPAALTVVLVVTMATGTAAMKHRHVIVRTMKSLEALGGVTNICTDKTGTLTEGAMVTKRAWLPGHGTYDVSNSGDKINDPTVGNLSLIPKQPSEWTDEDEERMEKGQCSEFRVDVTEEVKHPQVTSYLNVASLANVAVLHQRDKAEGQWHARGEPTEIAIQVFATRFDMNRSRLTSDSNPQQWKHVAEFPFDSTIKKMTSIYETSDGEQWVFTKGATEHLLPSCVSICIGDEIVPLKATSPMRREILANVEALAKRGLRVLSFATRTGFERYDATDRIPLPETEEEKEEKKLRLGDEKDFCDCHEVEYGSCQWHRDNFERELVFRGLIGLYDPPRPESADAVETCKKAGIKVHMLTGDHPETARSIAKQIGILPRRVDDLSFEVAQSMVMTGAGFDALSDDEIDALPQLPLVVARCSPKTKVNMVQAIHRRGGCSAMTGDGVNDAPALAQAHVGIAMGLNGSDVAKEAADIILADDNFRSILNAVEEGRRIFDNIQRFVLHVLAENIAQALVLLLGLVVKDAIGNSVFPLAPVEIMWVILITSGIPDMALGQEKAAWGIMSRPPHDNKVGIFTTELLIDMAVYGVWTAGLCEAAFVFVLYYGYDGQIGLECNGVYSEACDPVFRARATCFSCITSFALLLAWQVVDMRRSFFRMQAKPKNVWTQTAKDIWRNQWLFGSVVFGITSLFVIVQVPVLNTKVFSHQALSWEWGVVLFLAVVWFLGTESWKFAKRRYFRSQARKMTGGVVHDLEAKAFGHYFNTPGISIDKTDSA